MDIQRSDRPTICDGKVATFATGFVGDEGLLGETHRATGPFEISASRNGVVVHRASIRGKEDLSLFTEAMDRAFRAFYRELQ